MRKVRPQAQRRFWTFVNERQKIWYKRNTLKQKRPWTKDPTLHEFQFTNVYRELDRGTLFLTERILPKYEDPKDLLFNIIVYRLFNHIPTYIFISAMMDGKVTPKGWDWGDIATELRNWNEQGNQVFTAAFTVTGAAFAGSSNKIDNICYLIEEINQFLYDKQFNWWKDIWNAKTMEQAFHKLRKVRGFGPFLAYEIVIDINYAHRRWGENKFVNPGPGAKRGINAIYPDVHTTEGYVKIIKHLRDTQDKWLHKDFPYTGKVPRRMSLRNIEHSLCEFQKYEKRRRGIRTGRARVFTPSKAPLPRKKG